MRFRPELLGVVESPLVQIATAAEAIPGALKLCYGESDMHHLTRAEDLPAMPMIWHSFKLRPHNFFDRNPAIDLRTEFGR